MNWSSVVFCFVCLTFWKITFEKTKTTQSNLFRTILVCFEVEEQASEQNNVTKSRQKKQGNDSEFARDKIFELGLGNSFFRQSKQILKKTFRKKKQDKHALSMVRQHEFWQKSLFFSFFCCPKKKRTWYGQIESFFFSSTTKAKRFSLVVLLFKDVWHQCYLVSACLANLLKPFILKFCCFFAELCFQKLHLINEEMARFCFFQESLSFFFFFVLGHLIDNLLCAKNFFKWTFEYGYRLHSFWKSPKKTNLTSKKTTFPQTRLWLLTFCHQSKNIYRFRVLY